MNSLLFITSILAYSLATEISCDSIKTLYQTTKLIDGSDGCCDHESGAVHVPACSALTSVTLDKITVEKNTMYTHEMNKTGIPPTFEVTPNSLHEVLTVRGSASISENVNIGKNLMVDKWSRLAHVNADSLDITPVASVSVASHFTHHAVLKQLKFLPDLEAYGWQRAVIVGDNIYVASVYMTALVKLDKHATTILDVFLLKSPQDDLVWVDDVSFVPKDNGGTFYMSGLMYNYPIHGSTSFEGTPFEGYPSAVVFNSPYSVVRSNASQFKRGSLVSVDLHDLNNAPLMTDTQKDLYNLPLAKNAQNTLKIIQLQELSTYPEDIDGFFINGMHQDVSDNSRIAATRAWGVFYDPNAPGFLEVCDTRTDTTTVHRLTHREKPMYCNSGVISNDYLYAICADGGGRYGHEAGFWSPGTYQAMMEISLEDGSNRELFLIPEQREYLSVKKFSDTLLVFLIGGGDLYTFNPHVTNSFSTVKFLWSMESYNWEDGVGSYFRLFETHGYDDAPPRKGTKYPFLDNIEVEMKDETHGRIYCAGDNGLTILDISLAPKAALSVKDAYGTETASLSTDGILHIKRLFVNGNEVSA